ncbi:hypothetical protein STENM36S_07239 [Streptomyces tendae]
MRRILLLAPVLLFTAVGCGAAQSSRDEATDAARDAAREVGEQLYGPRPRTAEEVGRAASQLDGVEVMRVRGTSTHDGDGVDVVVRHRSGMSTTTPRTTNHAHSVWRHARHDWGADLLRGHYTERHP